jgi:hypothetical protein
MVELDVPIYVVEQGDALAARPIMAGKRRAI